MNAMNRIRWLGFVALLASLVCAALWQTVVLAQSELTIGAPPQVPARPNELITVTIDYTAITPTLALEQETRLYYEFEPIRGVAFGELSEEWGIVYNEGENERVTMRYRSLVGEPPTGTVTITLRTLDTISDVVTLQHGAFLFTAPSTFTGTPPFAERVMVADTVESVIVPATDAPPVDDVVNQRFVFDPPPRAEIDDSGARVSLHIQPPNDAPPSNRLKLDHAATIRPIIDQLERATPDINATIWEFPSGLQMPLQLRLEFAPETTQAEIEAMVLQIISAENEPYEDAFQFNGGIAGDLFNAVPSGDEPEPTEEPVEPSLEPTEELVEPTVEPTVEESAEPVAEPSDEQDEGTGAETAPALPWPWIAAGVVGVGLLGGLLFFLTRGRAQPTPAGQPLQVSQAVRDTAVPIAPDSSAMTQPHLRLQSDNRPFKIDPNSTTIGRGENNDIVIDDSFPGWESVSHEHARIVRHDIGYVIEDMGSSNGIFVQNRPTAKNLLKDGWTVGIGGVQFTFQNPEGGA